MNDVKITDGKISCDSINIEYLGLYHESIGYYILIRAANGDWINAYDNELDQPIETNDLNKTPHKFKSNLNNEELKSIVTTINNNVLFRFKEYGLNNVDSDYGYKLLDKITGSLQITNIKYKDLTPDKQDAIANIIETIKHIKLNGIRKEIIYLLENGKTPVKAKKLLSKYLELKHGIILRKNAGDIFKLDACGYSQVTIDDLVILLSDDLGNNIVSDKEIEESLRSISTRLEPKYNIVKFNNCLFDMEEMQIIEPDKPIFTLIESKYNYNPDAESTILKEFLYSSLERETQEETNRIVQGVLQLIGYLFTSGNKYNIVPIITGVGGGGKSVFSNILTAIFGSNKITGTSLQEMVKDTHATASFINKQLNIIRDSSNILIEDNGTFKTISGNEDIAVNPKFKSKFTLPAKEVPKTIIVCNNIPRFKIVEKSIIERLMIIEFLVKFRDTINENPNLERDILSNDEEIEWLIYQSINEYSKIEDKQDFNLKLSANDTLKLMDKHTQPINYLLSLVIDEHNPDKIEYNDADEYPPIVAAELNQVLVHLSKIYGVEIEVNKKGEIKPNVLLSAIKKEFDLYNGESVLTTDDAGNTYHKTRPYTTQPQYAKLRNNKTSIGEYVRCYPNLIANETYYTILDEIF